jgi:hypothetical protein
MIKRIFYGISLLKRRRCSLKKKDEGEPGGFSAEIDHYA